MNPFPKYLIAQLKDKLQQHRVVVWYDANQEFVPFVLTMTGEERAEEPISEITVDDLPAKLATYAGSFFALRRLVEPLVEVPRPMPLLIYIGGAHRDRQGSVLMELEMAGATYEPQLKRLARNVMRQHFSDGVIDEMLSPEGLTYEDVLSLLESGEDGGASTQPGSKLKSLFGNSKDNIAIVAKWLADPALDKSIDEKAARSELAKLIGSRAGFSFQEEWTLGQCRERLARFLLANEFRDDLKCDPPTSVSMVPKATQKEQREFGRAVLDHLRDRNGKEFEALADAVESELGLAKAEIPPEALGSIDTFRFEERAVLSQCSALVIAGSYQEASQQVEIHSKSFWARHDLARRQAQWEVMGLLAELGFHLKRVDEALKKIEGGGRQSSAKFVEVYTAPDGWYLLDLTQRRLESRVAQLDEEPDCEEALTIMRARAEGMVRKMATLFADALQANSWTVSGVLPQTGIYPSKVAGLPGKVAWFMVDALRYEMGFDLKRQLPEAADAELLPAIATLPSITPLCMAALLPGASSDYSVVSSGGKVAGKIGNAVLENVDGRMKYLKARVPDSTDISLERLLQQSPSKVLEKIGDSRLVVVRSQEIDALGEKNELLARHVMDTIIGNVARAARKLAKLGYERFVITADHGHLFGSRKEDDMKIDKPGGKEVEAHRRCWIGNGGQTPPAAVRITATDLGYDSDLEFVFPTGLGVFKTGGGLTYHHGGFSLQELVIPVLTFRIPFVDADVTSGPRVSLVEAPEAITNRTVGVKVEIEADFLNPAAVPLRVSLIAKGEEAGKAGMAIGGEFDHNTGVLLVKPGESSHVAMVLSREDFDSVKIVVQNAETGAVLCESKTLPVQLKL